MNIIVRFLMLSLLFCFPARAQEMRTGTGVICDTAPEIESVIRNRHVNVHQAIEEVNAGTNACGFITIVYLKGSKVAEVPVDAGIYDVFEITVIGAQSEDGWYVIPPQKQVTAFFRKGQQT